MALNQRGFTLADIPNTEVDALGPLLELHHSIDAKNGVEHNWLSSQRYASLLAAKVHFQPFYKEIPMHLGFAPAHIVQRDETEQTEFHIRAKRAAISAGFPKSDAAQLVASIMELYSNIVEHSQYVESGYIAFSAIDGCFEFVVADSGIGVLESLRRNPKYSSLEDSGSALELALTEGVSRHRDPAQGHGFRPLFVGLANIAQSIRFRSNDHSREIERKDNGSISSFTKQKTQLDGFFCSASCASP